MRSALSGVADAIRGIRNQGAAPVPYTSRRNNTGLALMGGGRGEDRGTQLAALGANSTLFAIVNKTSTALASVEWHLYKKAASGKKEDRTEVTSHVAIDLWKKPNDFYTGQVFREAWQQHVDLTGEGWWVIEWSSIMSNIPLGLWPVRPDRMTPVPSVDKFIAGYIYTSPDGEKIPLGLRDVICTKMPNPNDPYRGMGPVQSLLSTIDSVKYGVEWNRNFFLNSAEPGGVVQLDRRLDDDEFDEMTARWRESHQGVAQAHRVAILEAGATWVERKFTQRDMQFVELINLGREIIHEAFGMPRSMTGSVENVNRANAETGKEQFAEIMTVPRADRLRDTLNSWYLPIFGDTTKGLEWDYDDPTPDNEEQKNAKLTASSTAATILVGAGWQAPDVLEAVGLPPMQFGPPGLTPQEDLLVKIVIGAPTLAPVILPMLGYDLPAAPAPAPAPTPVPPAPEPPPAAQLESSMHVHGRLKTRPWYPRAAAPAGPTRPEEVDLTPVREAFDHALDVLLRDWSSITAAQYREVCDQVAAAINEDNVAALGSMTVSTADASAMLLDAMTALGAKQAAQVVKEGAAQGVSFEPVDPSAGELRPHAEVVAALLGTAVAMSAARSALQHFGEGRTGQQVADEVLVDLQALTDAQPKQLLGGALHGATNTARTGTLRRAPEAALYASEIMDTNTCGPCRDVDKKWLGNASDLEQVFKTYPFGGYIGCLGGDRCRGTVVAIWRPATVDNPDAKPGQHESTPEGPATPPTLADSIASGIESTEVLGGGMSAKTELVTLQDGVKAIRKTAKSSAQRDPIESSDAEELASIYARRLDIPAPEVTRAGSDTVWMAYVDGTPTAGEYYGQKLLTLSGKDEIVSGEAGRRIGLFDIVTANGDRGGGNWLVAAGPHPIPIDHGMSYVEWRLRDELLNMLTGPRNVFAHHLLDVDADGSVAGGSRDYSVSDIEHMRRTLKDMHGEFIRLNREKWYTDALGRLAFLEKHAGSKGELWPSS